MRALFSSRSKHDYLDDALTLLPGWIREGEQIRRTLVIDDSQHAALTERVKVVADALHLRPEISRLADQTRIRVGHGNAPLTEGEVLLAARIEDAYRAVTQP
ncbi:4a-hydroxytetrahydrobiopterin dehydratase [Micromonospora sp. DT46]|uniref:4a-hydroxytetrahydrobiopterin dehydratase n=1 Tax=unclassified Micromonospora TaxID=2617518 RepID=UPI00124B4DE4|nr:MULTISPECIES: 4a-hydroxytetrahydrobiopterin dehydratase [unclassified Micromonospora]KAB1152871.1 4a-hydroxytetrahydrobiopterin dehydratase [Micromonospora sp. AMSO12t]WSG02544.1 4a-hydroxytetrahydrobiopterin dehydratase [Micromonospora sp. NBC_01740]